MSNAASQEIEVFELEGIGEVRAREGTSTHALAGMARYWHDKYKADIEPQIVSARRTGFLGGSVFSALAILVSYSVYYLLAH